MIEAPADIEIATGTTETMTIDMAAATEIVTTTMTMTVIDRITAAGRIGGSIAGLFDPMGTGGSRTIGDLTDREGIDIGSG
jgi:hypothetical protein